MRCVVVQTAAAGEVRRRVGMGVDGRCSAGRTEARGGGQGRTGLGAAAAGRRRQWEPGRCVRDAWMRGWDAKGEDQRVRPIAAWWCGVVDWWCSQKRESCSRRRRRRIGTRLRNVVPTQRAAARPRCLPCVCLRA